MGYKTYHKSSLQSLTPRISRIFLPLISYKSEIAFFLMATRGQLLWFNEGIWLHCNLWENDPVAYVNYDL